MLEHKDRQVRGGAVINITSQMGHVGAPNRTVYCMTKHALEGLTKAMAVELAPRNIRVNSIAPTFVETPLTKSFLTNDDFKEWVLQRIPLGRLGNPEDIGWAIAFLASPAASMITGTSLVVDGGWTAQ
jgi:NAD(P)-dependent dehydrogenase (short-subunit alcohol dehydrogenase family)